MYSSCKENTKPVTFSLITHDIWVIKKILTSHIYMKLLYWQDKLFHSYRFKNNSRILQFCSQCLVYLLYVASFTDYFIIMKITSCIILVLCKQNFFFPYGLIKRLFALTLRSCVKPANQIKGSQISQSD